MNRLRQYALIAAIFVTSLLLWIVAPLGALWIVSRLTDSGFYIVLAGGGVVLPLLMAVFGLLLARLNGAYYRAAIAGGGAPRPVLEVSLTLSVVVAAVSLMVFFLFFAHNANPGL